MVNAAVAVVILLMNWRLEIFAFFGLSVLQLLFISMFSKKLAHPNYAGTYCWFVSPVNIISVCRHSYKDIILAGWSN
jgi:hypothetical protein